MPTGKRAALAFGLWAVLTPATAHATDFCTEHIRETIVEAVRGIVQQVTPGPSHPAPQAVAPGGPTVDIADLTRPEAVEQRVRGAAPKVGPELRLTVRDGQARLGDFTIGSAEILTGHLLVLNGNAHIYGKLLGNLVTVDGDVVLHPGGAVSGDILALHGDVKDQGGEVAGAVRTLNAAAPSAAARAALRRPSALEALGTHAAGVVGVFVTLLALGFGLVMFARPHLEVVSDTVSHSFGRSFITGLVGQILLLPTFGMLVVGLILSVAGILLLPFAVVVYALLMILGVGGGYLAVAHAIGETYARRRMARGSAMGSPNSYRYLMLGLIGLFFLWAAWVLFGWVPVAGEMVRGAAVLVTWLLATAGFGAALLSRAGLRENFAGRIVPPEALTDEYLWATPQFGVPAVRRPETTTPSGRSVSQPPDSGR